MILQVIKQSKTVTLFHAVPYAGAPKARQFPVTGHGADHRADARRKAQQIWSEIVVQGQPVSTFGGSES